MMEKLQVFFEVEQKSEMIFVVSCNNLVIAEIMVGGIGGNLSYEVKTFKSEIVERGQKFGALAYVHKTLEMAVTVIFQKWLELQFEKSKEL